MLSSELEKVKVLQMIREGRGSNEIVENLGERTRLRPNEVSIIKHRMNQCREQIKIPVHLLKDDELAKIRFILQRGEIKKGSVSC